MDVSQGEQAAKHGLSLRLRLLATFSINYKAVSFKTENLDYISHHKIRLVKNFQVARERERVRVCWEAGAPLLHGLAIYDRLVHASLCPDGRQLTSWCELGSARSLRMSSPKAFFVTVRTPFPAKLPSNTSSINTLWMANIST